MGQFKKIIKYSVLFLILIITVVSAVKAFEFDSIEDSYIVGKGDRVIGYFVIDDYKKITLLQTDFDWISFEDGKNTKSLQTLKGSVIRDGAMSVKYYINIPDDADVGIYRGVISAQSSTMTKYLNIKINVQNSFFDSSIDKYNNLSNATKILFYSSSMLIILFIIYMIIRGLLDGK